MVGIDTIDSSIFRTCNQFTNSSFCISIKIVLKKNLPICLDIDISMFLLTNIGFNLTHYTWYSLFDTATFIYDLDSCRGHILCQFGSEGCVRAKVKQQFRICSGEQSWNGTVIALLPTYMNRVKINLSVRAKKIL